MPIDELADNVTMYKTTLRKLYVEKNPTEMTIYIVSKVCRGRQGCAPVENAAVRMTL